ncbi:diacylglycerol kinase family protein [Ferruginibacter sp. SUN106]|uniref:diacylglycerol kinase family protein n=1 Tax=Ferruginibacter sp. SUN106 TaxID=2978348 RepID=UPI003D364281
MSSGHKIIKSFAFAWNGLKTCFISETNFKIHLLLAVIAISFGIGFSISGTEWLALIFCIVFVLVMEMINTAIEKICDVVHKDFHPGIKKIKDIAAGAVLVASGGASITGLVIFLPKIIIYIKSF